MPWWLALRQLRRNDDNRSRYPAGSALKGMEGALTGVDFNTLTLLGIAILNAFTAAIGIFAVYYAKQSQVATVKNKESIDLIERNTNSLSTRMADLARKNGIVEGVQQGRQYGVEQAASLAEGQRRGIEMERASVAAQVPVVPVAVVPVPSPLGDSGSREKGPVLVEDEAAATIAKAIAEATAVSAAATSEINKRVADATERSADAQQQIADVAKEKK